MSPLLNYAQTASDLPLEEFHLTRPQLNFVKSQSERAEEMLDGFGAKNNRIWYPIRENIALLKNFSEAAYDLLHLLYASQHYNLGEQLEQFVADTIVQKRYLAKILHLGLRAFLQYLEPLGIPLKTTPFVADFQEIDASLQLPFTRRLTETGNGKQQVDTLAISILNSTEEVNNFRHLAAAKPSEWRNLDFDFLSETRLRSMEVNMHVLQSMYDTYIANSEMERSDPDLPILRGRISTALHLLRVSTIFIHFYERHMKMPIPKDEAFLDHTDFFRCVIEYLARYIHVALSTGRKLCSGLLKKYCVVKTVQVKVPPYIGFHVRPSSLVAAIVLHYGCNVTMTIGDSSYDASIFSNIAMANNYIDQKKRAFLLGKLNELDLTPIEQKVANGTLPLSEAVTQVILHLASLNYLRIYQIPLQIQHIPVDQADRSLKSAVFETIRFLINNERQLGILFDVTVSFTGPEQAVDDIAALANANYCETERGEDLPLPRRLAYLNFKRKTLKKPQPQNG
ncbi:MAG: hypothetical protein IJJ26_01235 [Victivallales bacterium]|nr:hypothetical protein [Victivallales bacterium]